MWNFVCISGRLAMAINCCQRSRNTHNTYWMLCSRRLSKYKDTKWVHKDAHGRQITLMRLIESIKCIFRNSSSFRWQFVLDAWKRGKSKTNERNHRTPELNDNHKLCLLAGAVDSIAAIIINHNQIIIVAWIYMQFIWINAAAWITIIIIRDTLNSMRPGRAVFNIAYMCNCALCGAIILFFILFL